MEGEAPQQATEKVIPEAGEGALAEGAGLSAAGKSLIAGLSLLVLGVLGYGMLGQEPELQAQKSPEPVEAPVAVPVAVPVEAPLEAPVEEPLPQEAATSVAEVAAEISEPLQESAAAAQEIAPPSITTWAVTEEGIATIAGLAHPRASVQILRDGVEIEKTKASAQGEFALITTLAPNPAPSFLTLRMVLEDGRSLLSQSGVALGPIAGAKPPVEEPLADEPAAEAPALAEAERPAALLVTNEGALVLQSPETEAPQSGLSLAAISYSPEGAVQLSGRAAASSQLRLYLDNGPLQEVSVAASGQWLTTLPEIEPGRYLLRIDQIDAAGSVSARLETPFERETLARLSEVAAQTQSEPQPEAPEAPQPAAQEAAPAAPKAPISITVQPGHSLWAIAREQLGSGILYVQVLEANRDLIRNPDLIYPGQVFNLPKAE